MSYPSRLLVLGVCLLASLTLNAPAWAQPTSPVYAYVSTSAAGQIYSVDVNPNSNTYGKTTLLLSTSGADYEGLVVGPDNAGGSDPTYLLYACDPTNNTIVRFDPNNPPAQMGLIDTVYQGGSLQKPQCGRFTNVGDLIVTSEVAGSGAWDIAGVAAHGLGTETASFSPPAPIRGAFSGSQVSTGIAQKNIGDLLIVDSANQDVIRTPYTGNGSFSGVPSVFIMASSLLPGPYGIAKSSGGEIYISNQSKKTNDIVHYSAQGTNGSVCVSSTSFKKYTPYFMQMAAYNTLYVAAGSSNGGALFSVSSCSATQLSTSISLPPLVGIALQPTSVSSGAVAVSGSKTFNFGFAAFEFTGATCSALTITADEVNPETIQSLTSGADDPSGAFFGGAPAVDLGRDGFETAFDVEGASSCTSSASDGTFGELLASQLDNLLVPNPRVLADDANGLGTCGSSVCVVPTFGDYPLGGMLPQDTTISGRDGASLHFLINESGNNSEPGTFCGFGTPLTNTPPPGIAGVFSSGQTLSLKFELALGANNPAACQNGPFITDATALISVAQIYDDKGNPIFIPNAAIDASGNSTPVQPIFKNDPSNKQYQFSLNLKGYSKGIYSLTITFLSSNTSYQVAEIQVQ